MKLNRYNAVVATAEISVAMDVDELRIRKELNTEPHFASFFGVFFLVKFPHSQESASINSLYNTGLQFIWVKSIQVLHLFLSTSSSH